MRKKYILVILFSVFFLFVSASEAQQKVKKRIIYRKKSKVNFDDTLLEGSAENPEGIYIVTKPERKFKGLLRLRTNFHKELIRDSLLLK